MVTLRPETKKFQAVRSTFAWWKFAPASCVSFLSLIGCLLVAPSAWPGDLFVATDEPVAAQNQPAIETRDKQSPQSGSSTHPDSDASRQVEDEKSLQLHQHRELVSAPNNSSLEEEERLMAEVIQTLDRESASRWLAGFISSRPWNCPLRERKDWIEAILQAVERNQIPMCKEILGLAATLISIESGFHADPLVVDPSRRGSMEGLLKRAELKLFEKYGPLMPIPPIPKYYSAYKDKYWPQLLACHTESEVETVARRLTDELKKDAENFPSAVRSVMDQKITNLANVVRSKGSMQLKLFRARPALKCRGEEFTDEELIEYMYTINGGVDVGVAALKPMFVQYAARYAKKGDLSWLFFVGMDYHYGPFASRNMAEQLRIRDLSGQKIAIDGSFLNHDEDGRPEKQDSETLLAAAEACPSISKQTIFNVFCLERAPHYIYTDVHRSIVEAHRERYREIPFAVVGEIRMGESAEIKFGTKPTTRLYLNKLDRYLNSIPWDN